MILDNGVVPNNCELIVLGKKVIFLKPEDIWFRSIKDWIEFKKFEFANEAASVELTYQKRDELFHLELFFQFDNGTWKLSKRKG